MTPDPKLVEALARTWFIGWRPGHTWETATQDHRDLLLKTAREFIARYRLVQLPEEPSEWEVQWGSDDWIGFQTMEDAVDFANEHCPSTTGRIRAVRYVVEYSDLQEVEP